MKVLLMGLTPPEEGGSEKHIFELAERMPRTRVLTQRGSLVRRKTEVPVLLWGTFVRNVTFALMCYVYAFGLLFGRKRYDVVHVHENLLAFLCPLLSWRYKVVATLHGIEGFKYYDRKARWMFFRWAFRSADVIVAVSKEDEKKLAREFEKVVYVPNGVDNSVFAGLRVRSEKKLVFVGRMHEQKGVRYLLEAFASLRDLHRDWSLEMIGEVNEYSRALERKFGGERMKWHGFVRDRRKLARLLSSAGVIVLPSLWEGLPLVLFEALASGRAVLVSDIPSFRSVVRDEVEFARKKDSKDLAENMDGLMGDPKKRELLGKKGKALALQYDWNEIARRTEAVYANE
ncbi:hypothetical protein CMI48_00230 [Candidatus Pacearchaeota archaeon]|nr:hypothetical protein [Candidatus Pacearchaeota archaeon]